MSAKSATATSVSAIERDGSFNKYGQKIGSKGEKTRQQLIECTVRLLETHGLRDVSVAEVTRAARTSPATFYVYFDGVPDAVLAALDGVSQTSPQLESLLAQDWLAGQGNGLATAFVEAYTELWNSNRTIFRVRNLAAEEGDARFSTARQAAAAPMLARLAELVAGAQRSGKVSADLSAPACAATLLMMLERLAAVGPTTPPTEGLNYPMLKAAAARTVATMLGASE